MGKNIKTLVIIPARFASTRFPGKPLVELNGKAILHWVCERCNDLARVDAIKVATDNLKIKEAVESWGYDAIMTSADHASGTDRIGEVAEQFPDYDLILNVQGDEPLLNPSHLDFLIEIMIANPGLEIATLMVPIDQAADLNNPNIVKVAHEHHLALYFSRLPIPYNRDAPSAIGQHYNRHLGIYIFKRDILLELVKLPESSLEKMERLEQLRWLANGFQIGIAAVDEAGPGIDHPEDLGKAEKWLAEREQ